MSYAHECCICFRDIVHDDGNGGQLWTCRQCQQSVHTSCVHQWFQKINSCPWCRMEPASLAHVSFIFIDPCTGWGDKKQCSHLAHATSCDQLIASYRPPCKLDHCPEGWEAAIFACHEHARQEGLVLPLCRVCTDKQAGEHFSFQPQVASATCKPLLEHGLWGTLCILLYCTAVPLLPLEPVCRRMAKATPRSLALSLANRHI